MKFVWGILFTIVLLVILGLVTIYSGFVNVSALQGTSGVQKWVLSTTMETSVEKRAKKIEVPDLQDEEKIRMGGGAYIAMCEQCHGAPGWTQSELARGLDPEPPLLYQAEEAEEWDAAEMFWITKHGVKMTGMPAWGATHSDDKIWNMVAFLRKLPELTVDEYNQYSAASEEEEHEHSEEEGQME